MRAAVAAHTRGTYLCCGTTRSSNSGCIATSVLQNQKPELLVNVSLETSFTLSMCWNSAGMFSEMSTNHPLPNSDNIDKEMTFLLNRQSVLGIDRYRFANFLEFKHVSRLPSGKLSFDEWWHLCQLCDLVKGPAHCRFSVELEPIFLAILFSIMNVWFPIVDEAVRDFLFLKTMIIVAT
jgi:hypothetical protein